MKSKFIIIAALLAGSIDAQAGAVITSANSAYPAMDAEQVKRVFLGRETSLGGRSVSLVFQKSGTVRERFDGRVLGKPGAQLTSYWSKLIFTGKARAPEEVGSDAEVLARVAADPNAIGYVGTDAVPASAKVLHSF